MKKFVLFLVWILSIVSCEPPEEPHSGFGELKGNLYFKNETNPLQGYGIRVAGNALAFTDANGYFSFPKLPEGLQKLEVLLDMESIQELTINISSDKKVQIQVFLSSLKGDLPDFSVVDISKESSWDYWVVGKEEYFYIDAKNNLPVFAFLHSFKTGKSYDIEFTAKGLPSKVRTEGFIFLFDNFNGNKVDIGLIYPSGEIIMAREVKSDFVWPIPTKSTMSRADIIRWTGRILGAIPCVTSGAAAFATGGFAIPLALWTCGNYLTSMTNNFFDDAHVENGFTEFVDNYHLLGTYYTCSTDVSSCVIGLANAGLDSYADYIEEMDQREEIIRIAEAALYTGYGDIQITLTWDNKSDLDLHVVDPFQEEISWNNPIISSGGTLDYDDTDGYGPENVYWPKGSAPNGTYQVFLHNYFFEDKPGSANYIVLINAFGKTWKFQGTIYLGKTVRIANFDKNGLIPLSKSMIITEITIKTKK